MIDSPDLDQLYVAQVPKDDGRIQHVICSLLPVYDGGMYEFVDPISHDVVGSVGCNRLDEYIMPLDTWTEKFS